MVLKGWDQANKKTFQWLDLSQIILQIRSPNPLSHYSTSLGIDCLISMEILLVLNQIRPTRLTKRGYDRVVLRARCGSKNQWLKIDPCCSTEIALHWVKSLDRLQPIIAQLTIKSLDRFYLPANFKSLDRSIIRLIDSASKVARSTLVSNLFTNPISLHA
jgi:hypothetical protein